MNCKQKVKSSGQEPIIVVFLYLRLLHNAKCIMFGGRKMSIIIIICKRHNNIRELRRRHYGYNIIISRTYTINYNMVRYL